MNAAAWLSVAAMVVSCAAVVVAASFYRATSWHAKQAQRWVQDRQYQYEPKPPVVRACDRVLRLLGARL